MKLHFFLLDMALGLLPSQTVVSGSVQNIPQSGVILLLVRPYVIMSSITTLTPWIPSNTCSILRWYTSGTDLMPIGIIG